MPTIAQARRIARQVFEYDTLTEAQEASIRAILRGRDALAIMPTGAGKSAIYQIAGMLLQGPTVVISPLVALQHDQVASMSDAGAAPAAGINASGREADRRRAFRHLEQGRLEYVLLAPEQLSNAETLRRLRRSRPSLFVVDEAHCVSSWGHDFRPDYLRVGSVIRALGHPVTLAMTATAAPPVREEITSRLCMREPELIVRGFDRPNILLDVERVTDERRKRERLLERMRTVEGQGIVYAATRARAEEISSALRADGIAADHYHAGLRGRERARVQDGFMEGSVRVVVATTAFGMGIDKPDVRFVFHYEAPDSLDAYYQEVGRAGRDGEPATALLLFRPEDLGLRRFFAGAGRVDAALLETIARILKTARKASVEELAERGDASQGKVFAAIGWLEDAGVAELRPGDVAVWTGRGAGTGKAAAIAAAANDAFLRVRSSRVDMMRSFAETDDCRGRFLLNYFGEPSQSVCRHCDNCVEGKSDNRRRQETPFALNARVRHEQWGEGMIVRYEDGKIVVLFDAAGYKTLSSALVRRRQLLRPAG